MLAHVVQADLFAARTMLNPDPESPMHTSIFTVKSSHIPKQQKKAQKKKQVNERYSFAYLENCSNTHIDAFLTKSLKHIILGKLYLPLKQKASQLPKRTQLHCFKLHTSQTDTKLHFF